MSPTALPGGQILKIWTNGLGWVDFFYNVIAGRRCTEHLQNMFVKLFKSLAPGRAAGGKMSGYKKLKLPPFHRKIWC